ncbi:Toluene efflux pump periplasmic linker protein TtgG [Pseudoalteromonas holothuriae]|uniref:Toluene efflux pump periplasmic linker protein TtgG n=1 Tax=Pseudoalteromonas holothuriae TaxID=2963714 RepID=A0ABN8ULB0_9GAMM|nr:efflux RND transporter periplasmic adaptor subunit [Pseudoalteromonas sp. CIP111951]CAH9059331.1 Toluene efflux pump periplasmic linker protein TtgG [Pseudoalteromonas sp. CIP111951]
MVIVRHVLLFLLSGILLSACSPNEQSKDQSPQLRPVRTITVSLFHAGPVQEFPGVVDAANTAQLSFKVSGEVSKLLVKQGQEVKKGDVIATLNDTDYKLSLEEAQASFDKANADFGRAEKLLKTGTISKADYDQLKLQFASAKNKLATAKNNLEYTTLHASFSGVVARTQIEQFEEVQAKQAIATLQDIQTVNVKVNVPESVMINVSKDVPKQVYAEFSAIEDQRFPLTFVEVSTKANEITNTYEVTLSMTPPTGYNILPGMTAKVFSSQVAVDKQAIYLPVKTVLKDQQGNYVWTVEAVGDNQGKIIKTPVTIGEMTQYGFQIINGVSAGEHVVSAGMSKVSDGQLVKFMGGEA